MSKHAKLIWLVVVLAIIIAAIGVYFIFPKGPKLAAYTGDDYVLGYWDKNTLALVDCATGKQYNIPVPSVPDQMGMRQMRPSLVQKQGILFAL